MRVHVIVMSMGVGMVLSLLCACVNEYYGSLEKRLLPGEAVSPGINAS
jgi:Na+-transporting methylmalonyl-CoA/oxaloacetate decarboxylase gamma subunit